MDPHKQWLLGSASIVIDPERFLELGITQAFESEHYDDFAPIMNVRAEYKKIKDVPHLIFTTDDGHLFGRKFDLCHCVPFDDAEATNLATDEQADIFWRVTWAQLCITRLTQREQSVLSGLQQGLLESITAALWQKYAEDRFAELRNPVLR